MRKGGVLLWGIDGAKPGVGRCDTGSASGATDPAAIGIAGHVIQWRDLLDVIAKGEIAGRDGADAVRLVCAICEIARTGHAMRLEDLS